MKDESTGYGAPFRGRTSTMVSTMTGTKRRWGGGGALENEIYGKHGLFKLDRNAIGPKTSGWFKKPIESFDQLKGWTEPLE